MTNRLKNDLDDAFGEHTVKQANEARLVKDARTGQRSLFLDYFDDENKKGMKQAAVDKFNKADEEKEAKKAYDANRKAAARSGGGGGSGSMTDPMERKTKPYNKAKGGVIKSASKRADGCCIKGKTRA